MFWTVLGLLVAAVVPAPLPVAVWNTTLVVSGAVQCAVQNFPPVQEVAVTSLPGMLPVDVVTASPAYHRVNPSLPTGPLGLYWGSLTLTTSPTSQCSPGYIWSVPGSAIPSSGRTFLFRLDHFLTASGTTFGFKGVCLGAVPLAASDCYFPAGGTPGFYSAANTANAVAAPPHHVYDTTPLVATLTVPANTGLGLFMYVCMFDLVGSTPKTFWYSMSVSPIR